MKSPKVEQILAALRDLCAAKRQELDEEFEMHLTWLKESTANTKKAAASNDFTLGLVPVSTRKAKKKKKGSSDGVKKPIQKKAKKKLVPTSFGRRTDSPAESSENVIVVSPSPRRPITRRTRRLLEERGIDLSASVNQTLESPHDDHSTSAARSGGTPADEAPDANRVETRSSPQRSEPSSDVEEAPATPQLASPGCVPSTRDEGETSRPPQGDVPSMQPRSSFPPAPPPDSVVEPELSADEDDGSAQVGTDVDDDPAVPPSSPQEEEGGAMDGPPPHTDDDDDEEPMETEGTDAPWRDPTAETATLVVVEDDEEEEAGAVSSAKVAHDDDHVIPAHSLGAEDRYVDPARRSAEQQRDEDTEDHVGMHGKEEGDSVGRGDDEMEIAEDAGSHGGQRRTRSIGKDDKGDDDLPNRADEEREGAVERVDNDVDPDADMEEYRDDDRQSRGQADVDGETRIEGDHHTHEEEEEEEEVDGNHHLRRSRSDAETPDQEMNDAGEEDDEEPESPNLGLDSSARTDPSMSATPTRMLSFDGTGVGDIDPQEAKTEASETKASPPAACATDTRSRLVNLVTSMTSFLPMMGPSAHDASNHADGTADADANKLEVVEAKRRELERREMELTEKRKAAAAAKMREIDQKQKRAEAKRRQLAEIERKREMERQKREEERERRLKEQELARKKQREDEEQRREEKRRRIEEHKRRLALEEDNKRRELENKLALGGLVQPSPGILRAEHDHQNLPSNGLSLAATTPGTLKSAVHRDQLLMPPPKGIPARQTPQAKKALTEEEMTSYEMTSERIHDNDDDSTDEETDTKNNKKIPTWARQPHLANALEKQASELQDPDKIFPRVNATCDLEAVFAEEKKKKKRYRTRGSSSNWVKDRLTWKEEMEYKKAVGLM